MTNTSQLDQLSSLLEQESLAYRTSDYLRKPQTQQESVLSENLSISQIHGSKKRKLLPSTSPRAVGNDKSFIIERPLMNHEWRLKMVEWTYRVIDHLRMDREIISVTTNYLDRCLATYSHEAINKELLQLLTMACLYIAMKLFELKTVKVPGAANTTMESLIYLAKAKFTVKQMQEMEFDVLKRLKWRVHPPTPQVFVEYFAPDSVYRKQARYLVELATLDYFFVTYKPSEVAAAALLRAVDVASSDLAFSDKPVLPNHLQDRQDDTRVLDCKHRIALLLPKSDNSFLSEETDSVSTNKDCDCRMSPVCVTFTPTAA